MGHSPGSPMFPFYSTYYKKLEGTFKLKSAMAALIENINIQNVPEKRKYPKDNPAAAKKRNDARKDKAKPFEGKVNFSCESVEERERIYNLASQVKDTIGGGNPSRVSNKDMLNEVFNFYLRNNTSQENFDEPGDYIPFADTSFTKCDEKEDTSQPLFIASTSAIGHLIKRITNHRILCNSLVKIKTCKLLSHVAYCKLQCDNKHEISWLFKKR